MLSKHVLKPTRDSQGEGQQDEQPVELTKEDHEGLIKRIENVYRTSQTHVLSAKVEPGRREEIRSEGLFPSKARVVLHFSLFPVEDCSLPTSQTT